MLFKKKKDPFIILFFLNAYHMRELERLNLSQREMNHDKAICKGFSDGETRAGDWLSLQNRRAVGQTALEGFRAPMQKNGLGGG